jgi:hypothetical protein
MSDLPFQGDDFTIGTAVRSKDRKGKECGCDHNSQPF